MHTRTRTPTVQHTHTHTHTHTHAQTTTQIYVYINRVDIQEIFSLSRSTPAPTSPTYLPKERANLRKEGGASELKVCCFRIKPSALDRLADRLFFCFSKMTTIQSLTLKNALGLDLL